MTGEEPTTIARALRYADDWATGRRDAKEFGAHPHSPTLERRVAEAQESMKWSMLAIALAVSEICPGVTGPR